MWQRVSLWSPAPYFLQPCLGLAFLLKGYSFQDGACRQCPTAVPQDGVAGGVSPALETGSHGSCSFPSAATQGKWVCRPAAQAVMGQWWGHVSATHLMLWVGHQPCCSLLCQGQLSWATHHMLFWKSKPQLVSCLVQLKWVLISAEHLDWDQPGLFTTCRKKKRLFLPNPKCISISKCGRNLWLFPKNISTLFVVLLQIAGNLAGANRGRNVTLGSSDFLLWVLHSQQNCQPTFKDVQVSWWPGSENKSHLGTPLTFAPSPEVVKSRLDGAFSNLF